MPRTENIKNIYLKVLHRLLADRIPSDLFLAGILQRMFAMHFQVWKSHSAARVSADCSTQGFAVVDCVEQQCSHVPIWGWLARVRYPWSSWMSSHSLSGTGRFRHMYLQSGCSYTRNSYAGSERVFVECWQTHSIWSPNTEPRPTSRSRFFQNSHALLLDRNGYTSLA